MIQLFITMTGKGYGSKEKYRIFHTETKNFPSVKDAKDWIKETYGKAKRVPMYVDTKEGTPKKVGYVIGFRGSDISHTPVEKWLQQDWLEFREVKPITP